TAQRRVPLRVRHPLRIVVALLIVAAAVVVAFVLLANRTHHGTGLPPGKPPEPGLRGVPLRQDAAHDFDPYGSGATGEHPEQAKRTRRSTSSAYGTPDASQSFP